MLGKQDIVVFYNAASCLILPTVQVLKVGNDGCHSLLHVIGLFLKHVYTFFFNMTRVYSYLFNSEPEVREARSCGIL